MKSKKPNLHSTKLAPFTVWFSQSEEFHTLKQEIFTQDAYYTEFDTTEPVIIDAGAHIGLASLYFKKLYPKARIWAVEPLLETFTILKRNVEENVLLDVELMNAALTESGSQSTIYFDNTPLKWWSTAGRENGAWNHQQDSQSRQVPSVQLSSLIKRINAPIDLIKMDIEGNELVVLKEAQSDLENVKNMIIEFHPIKTQTLSHLLTLLDSSGFSWDLWQNGKAVSTDRLKGLVYIQATRN